MSTREPSARGIIYTFYSFKGGVGRSMAVANAAALLAKWGHSVLVVDWDLEAPGLERFFAVLEPEAQAIGDSRPGIVDLIHHRANGKSLKWQDCVQRFRVDGSSSRISLIPAGKRGANYIDQMQKLDFPTLFSTHNLGAYIEELRISWVSNFDYVLIDSRTGVTDIGGICTVHLADVLILLFTSTDSSVEGGLEIVNRVRAARERLPLDRDKLLVVPLPAKDESRTEYERAAGWKKKFAEKFNFLYQDWLPDESLIPEAIEILRIPYVPYWSFGERLPVLEESSSDPAGLAYAYEFLARLLVSKLDWDEALEGRTLLPPPRAERRTLDDKWQARHREAALTGLKSLSKTAYMEGYHCCVDSPIERSQEQLLTDARRAVAHPSWPIGVVLDREDARPKPTKEGIIAEIKSADFTDEETYDYWVLTRKGDFYFLSSLPGDNLQAKAIDVEFQVLRTTEILLHCGNLYRALGANSKATIQCRVGYGGLRGRRLKTWHRTPSDYINHYEDEVSADVVFRLDQIESEMTQLVVKLCRPMFVLFNFFSLAESEYERLIDSFVSRRVS